MALRLLVAAVALVTPPHPGLSAFIEPVLFPLLEASGSASGDVLAVGHFCGAPLDDSGGGMAIVANTTTGDVWLMAGPTPHVVHCVLAATSWAKGARGLAAGDLDGDGAAELIVLGATGGVSLVEISHAAGACTQQCSPAAARVLAEDNTVAAVAIAVLPKPSPSGAQLLAITAPSSGAPPFALLRYDDKARALRVGSRTELGITARAGWTWSSVTAGGSSEGLLVAVTRVRDDSSSTAVGGNVEVIALSAGSSGTLAPTANITVSLGSALLTTLIADMYGDGAPGLMIIERDTTMHYIWLPEADGGGAGAPLAHQLIAEPGGKVVTDSNRSWVAATTGAWLGSRGGGVLPGEVQLFGLRAPDHTRHFQVSIVVHARPEHWMVRRASLANLRATQEFKATYNDSGRNVAGLSAPLDIDKAKRILTSTNVNTFLMGVCDCTPDWKVPTSWGCSRLDNYDDFVRLLDATRGFTVQGEQVRIWLGLNPPTEAGNRAVAGGCNIPTDSPLTPFNETEIFADANYTTYDRWGILAGELAAWANHLVAVDIDDFTSNIGPGKAFTGTNVAVITSNMRSRAPWLCLASVVYVEFTALPDVPYMLDAPVFFFRNAVEGAGPCAPAACPWGPHDSPPWRPRTEHKGACLAGRCSEPTTPNLASELATLTSGMPPGRRIIVGYYSTGHSSSGQPSPRYVSRLLQTAAVQPGVDGIMTYTMKAALQPCLHPPLYGADEYDDSTPAGGSRQLDHQMGCIVRRAYGVMARANASLPQKTDDVVDMFRVFTTNVLPTPKDRHVLENDDFLLAPPRRTWQPGIITWDTSTCPCSNIASPVLNKR